jgi:hypothetical protein
VPLSIVATVGASNANSFVTEAEMDAYVEGRLNSAAWTSDAAALPALVEATRDLSNLSWKGWRVTETQALSWPREHVRDPDAIYDEDVGELGFPEYPVTEIPQRIKDATCELALAYLKAGATDLASVDADTNLTSKTVGPLSKSWGPAGKPTGLSRFPRVQQLIAPLLSPAASGLTVVRV